MYRYAVIEVGPKEWHVIESRFVGEPEYILARCTGPVPAGQIADAMRLANSVTNGQASIHNAMFGLRDALERFKASVKDATAAKDEGGDSGEL